MNYRHWTSAIAGALYLELASAYSLHNKFLFQPKVSTKDFKITHRHIQSFLLIHVHGIIKTDQNCTRFGTAHEAGRKSKSATINIYIIKICCAQACIFHINCFYSKQTGTAHGPCCLFLVEYYKNLSRVFIRKSDRIYWNKK